jgi:hypothetical protein
MSDKDDYGKIREQLVGRGTDYRTTKRIVEGKTVGNNPMPTAGSRRPHGWGHTASQKDGHLRLSGDPKAHRLGKK